MGFWFVFIGLGGGGFEVFFPGGGEFDHQKDCPRGLPRGGGWSGLELTDA